MARYTGPVCRLCRRESQKLFLKGSRCFTEKCSFERRQTAPGMHGDWKRKPSEYAIRLREKQKLRRVYGLLEKPFRNLFEKASRKAGVTGEIFLGMLERRLDNVIYRLGFANSRNQARQMARHGFFTVNGSKVNIPSYQLRPGDVVALSDRGKKSPLVSGILEVGGTSAVPGWLAADMSNLRGQVVEMPGRAQIDVQVNEQLVVEFYSR